MMNDSIEVEVNLTAARKKRREEGDRRKDKEARMDMMVKPVENLIERLAMENRAPPRKN